MGMFGQRGSDHLKNVDLTAGLSLFDLLSDEDIEWMRTRADAIGRDVKTRISRQRDLGAQRARGASTVGVQKAAARYFRASLDQTLRKVEAMRDAKNKVIEMGDGLMALELDKKRQGSMVRSAKEQIGQNLAYHTGIAGIKTGEYLSRKRAFYKGLQGAASIGFSMFGDKIGNALFGDKAKSVGGAASPPGAGKSLSGWLDNMAQTPAAPVFKSAEQSWLETWQNRMDPAPFGSFLESKKPLGHLGMGGI